MTISGTATVDGITTAIDDRVLLIAQTTTADNGVWLVKSGAWQRPTDATSPSDINAGATFYVTDGAKWKNTTWRQTVAGPSTFSDVRFARVESSYNIMQFGARGDGSDDRGAIQAALAAANAAGGGRVEIPPGTFVIGAALTIPNNVILAGAGPNASMIRAIGAWTNVAGGGMIELRGTTQTTICDLALDATGGTRSGSNAIDHVMVCAGASQCTIERVRFLEGGLPTGTPSGPVLLLVAKDLSTDLGSQFGSVPSQSCSGNAIRDCEFVQSAGRIAKGVGLMSDWGWITPNTPKPYAFASSGPLTNPSAAIPASSVIIPIVATGTPFLYQDPILIRQTGVQDHLATVTAATPTSLTITPATVAAYSTSAQVGVCVGGVAPGTTIPGVPGANVDAEVSLLRSRSLDAGGDAFINHVEGNVVERCLFTGVFANYAVGLQGGGTRGNVIRDCRFGSIAALFAVLVDKGAYANRVTSCSSLSQTRDSAFPANQMNVFTANSHHTYRATDNQFQDCLVVGSVGSLAYDCAFGGGTYTTRTRFVGCKAIAPRIGASAGNGFVFELGSIDMQIIGCTVQGADAGINSNLGGPPVRRGSGGLIDSNVLDVATLGVFVHINPTSSVQHNGVVMISRNIVHQTTTPATQGAISTGPALNAVQIRDNWAERSSGAPGTSGDCGFYVGSINGLIDGNFARGFLNAYNVASTYVGRWGDCNSMESCTNAFDAAGAPRPLPRLNISFELPVAGVAFDVLDNPATKPTFSAAAGEWSFVSGTTKIGAPVVLPVGTRINAVMWNFNKGGSATAMVFLIKKRTASGTVTVLDTMTDTTTGTTFHSATNPFAIYYVVEAGVEVWLEVQGAVAAHKFGYASVLYDRV